MTRPTGRLRSTHGDHPCTIHRPDRPRSGPRRADPSTRRPGSSSTETAFSTSTPPTARCRSAGCEAATRCAWSTRNWRSRASRSATSPPSSPPGWSRRRSGSSPRTSTATSSTTPSTRISAEIEQRCIRMLADLFHAPGRDHRRPHPGLLGGDHARRPLAEVEVERAGARRPARQSTSRTWSSAATCTWSGRSSAATSTSSRGSCRCRRTST